MKRMIIGLMAAVMLGSVLAGCSKHDPGAASQTQSAQPTETGAAASTGASGSSAEGSMKIGILLKTLSNPFWVDMAEGIKAAAKQRNIEVDILAMESEAEVEGQLKKMEDMINSGSYDGIGIAPITGTNLVNGVVAANAKQIPVVNIDAKIDETALKAAGGYVVGFATSDNFKVGQIGAQYIMEQVPDGGKVAIIEGRAGDLSGELRRDGCKDVLSGNTAYEVCDVQPADWDRQKALDVATNIINKHPDVRAFFVANDTMALGVLQALENTNNTGKILLVGTDASEETRAAIQDGKMAAVVQDPASIGVTCFDILIEAIKEGRTGSDGKTVEKLVEAHLVTK